MNKLNDSYTLWLHNVFDSDWSINSYKKIYTFNVLENGIGLINNINNELIEKTMLFLMKNDIKPIWEDEKNCNGGCFSYKISNNIIGDVWRILNYCFIGNSLSSNENIMNNISGISISPKKTYCIIKIWISNISFDILKDEYFDKFIEEQLNNISNDNNTNYEYNYKDPFNINELCSIEKQQCIFRKHNVLY